MIWPCGCNSIALCSGKRVSQPFPPDRFCIFRARDSVMQAQNYPPDTGVYAKLSADEKKKRLDAMVRIWQSDTERRLEREGYRAFINAQGLDEYRCSVSLRSEEHKSELQSPYDLVCRHL